MNKKTRPSPHFSFGASLRWLTIGAAAFAILLLPPQNTYALKKFTAEYHTPQVLSFPSPHPIPVKTGATLVPDMTAEGVFISDVDTGMTLFEKNSDEVLPPASTTKIMTALVTLDNFKLDDIATVKTMITEKTLMGLVSGEQITIEHLLYGALVESGNDAAYALAEHDSSGVDGFVAKMNAKASSLFLSHTHYQNPIGFDDPAQYTTARDLARLTRIALHNDEINKIVGTVSITVPDITYSIFHPLKNVNQLLGKVAGVTGFKTGTTASAGECLVTTVQRKGHKIIVVVLKSTDRFGESEALINWVYNNFQWQPVGAAA